MADEQTGDLLDERMSNTDTAHGSGDNQSDAGSGGQETAAAGTDQSKDLPGWRKQLTPELQRNKSLDKFDGESPISKLAAGYIEAEGRLGKSILVPGEDATDEERSDFLAKIRGVETKSDYELPDVDVPEVAKSLIGDADAFRERAFAMGWTKEQAAAQFQHEADILNRSLEMGQKVLAKKATDAKAELQAAWPGDDYEQNMTIAERAMKRFLSPDRVEELKAQGRGNDPNTWRDWHAVGKMLSDGTLGAGQGGSNTQDAGMAFPLAAKIARGEQVD